MAEPIFDIGLYSGLPITKYLVIFVTLIAVLVARLFLTPSDELSKYPLWGEHLGSYKKMRIHFLTSAADAYRDSYRRFRDSLWRITTLDGVDLMLPLKYADELRAQPEDVVNNVVVLEEVVEKKYLGLDPDNPHLTHVIKTDLTRNLPFINELLSEEARKAVDEALGHCEDWAHVPAFPKLLQIVAVVSGAVFVGPELCRKPEWLNATINYTIDLFGAAALLKQWPRIFRPVVKYWIPKVDAVHAHRRVAHKLLVPIIKERRARRDREPDSAPNDMLQWLVNKAPSFGQDDEKKLAESQLTLSLAAIHTTTNAATHILYDIVGHCPEIIPELRAEILKALEEEGGVMSTQALFRMKLLDSVLRESQRLSPFSISRMVRRVLKPFRFADGTAIPAGVKIGMPLQPVLVDPDFYTDPDVFDPYRFLRLRTGEAEDPLRYPNREQYQYVSITKENMSFGYGRHACPGRFFAANELKFICAQILLRYDMKLPEGVNGRYANFHQEAFILPDPTKTIMMRKVRGVVLS